MPSVDPTIYFLQKFIACQNDDNTWDDAGLDDILEESIADIGWDYFCVNEKVRLHGRISSFTRENITVCLTESGDSLDIFIKPEDYEKFEETITYHDDSPCRTTGKNYV